MAWTAPATAVVGTLNTAALWNTNVRDNLLWLSSPDRCRTIMNAGQSIPNNTNTAVTWTTSDTYDTANMHSLTTNPSRITIHTTGLYAVAANVWFGGNATGFRQILLYRNGAQYGLYGQNEPGNTGAFAMSLYDEVSLTAGDYIETWVQQTSGAALTINSSAGDAAYMTCRWVATS